MGLHPPLMVGVSRIDQVCHHPIGLMTGLSTTQSHVHVQYLLQAQQLWVSYHGGNLGVRAIESQPIKPITSSTNGANNLQIELELPSLLVKHWGRIEKHRHQLSSIPLS